MSSNRTITNIITAIVVIIAAAVVINGIIASTPFIAGNNTENTEDAESTEQQPKSNTEIRRESKIETIPFEIENYEDPNIEYGTTIITTEGVNGQKTYYEKVTYVDGNEISREPDGEEITKNPIHQRVAHGTKVIWRCVDATSYDKNPYNDNRCSNSLGEVRYVSDSESRALDPTYRPGQSGHWYYNSK